MELTRGSQVDRYQVEGILGRGGMAVVYRVRHAQLGSLHAMKVLTLPSASVRERLLAHGEDGCRATAAVLDAVRGLEPRGEG